MTLLRSPESKRLPYLAAVVLAVAAALAYANSFSGPFVFDDTDAIVDNPSIRHFATALAPPLDNTASGRPVLNLSLALSYAISGDGVAGYHALNLALHIAAGLALFGIVRRTLRQPRLAPRFGPAATGLAFAVALLWTVHPLQTESVTYVIQRAESLMGLFYLLTLYCFVRYADAAGDAAIERGIGDVESLGDCGPGPRPQPEPADRRGLTGRASAGTARATRAAAGWATAAVAACCGGMATKEVMVTAPVVVLLYDRTFLSDSFKEALRRRPWLYAALAAAWILLAVLVLGTGGNRSGTIGFGIGVPWWKYALTQFRAVTTYLGLAVFPHPLNFDRGPYWVTSGAQVLPWMPAVLFAVGGTLVALRRRWPVAFLGGWFLLILSPTSSIVPGTTQMIVEHRLYLPLAAVTTLLVLATYRTAGRWALGGAVLAAAALALATAARNTVYRGELTLWADVVAKDPANGFAQLNYGVALADAGQLEAAVAHERLAVRFSPGSVEAHTNLANALLKLGHPDEAVAEYTAALRVNPSYAQARIDYGNALLTLGQPAAAQAQYREAITLQPQSVEAHNNLGLTLLKTGSVREAVAAFQTALQLNPRFAPAECNLGNALRLSGHPRQAIARYKAALRLNPAYPAAALNLGNLLLQEGELDQAIARFQAALDAAPNSAELHNSLGLALARRGRLEEATAHFRAAVRLNPDYAAANANLQAALRALERR